ncbi:hypothetical protein [Gellertiella hungarica]|uniref:Uncharacterized protein n=1 Tax=Gellertiella hungarica TaxID=1572859 RepID=A0A7W6NMD1_9HYPH|nr:hypothetical protein [Gellertiella hungarica]MBB4066818.1 hypothetical protein [Gellertiella hungarica]
MNGRHVHWEQLVAWVPESELKRLEAMEVGYREAAEADRLFDICPVRQCRRKRQCQGPLATRPEKSLWPEDMPIELMTECLWRYPGEKWARLQQGLARIEEVLAQGRKGSLPGRELMADRIRRDRAERKAAKEA